MSGVIIPALNWMDFPVTGQRLRRVGAFARISNPTILVDVSEVRGTRTTPGGTEIRIVAFFRWPTLPERKVQHLFLRRTQLVEVHGSFEQGKVLAEAMWADVKRTEEELLIEMWSLPVMSATELEAYKTKWKLKRKAAEEEAAPLIEERKQEIALEGGRVD